MIYDCSMDITDIKLIEDEMQYVTSEIAYILHDKEYQVTGYNKGSFDLSTKLDVYHKNLSFSYDIPYIILSPDVRPIDLEIPNFLSNNWKMIYRYSKLHRKPDGIIYMDSIIDNLDVDFMIIRFNDDKLSIFKDLISDLGNKAIAIKAYEYYKKFLEAEYELLDWVRSLEKRKEVLVKKGE